MWGILLYTAVVIGDFDEDLYLHIKERKNSTGRWI